MLRSLTAMARLRFKPGRLVPDRTAGRIIHDDTSDSLTRLPRIVTTPMSWLYGLGR